MAFTKQVRHINRVHFQVAKRHALDFAAFHVTGKSRVVCNSVKLDAVTNCAGLTCTRLAAKLKVRYFDLVTGNDKARIASHREDERLPHTFANNALTSGAKRHSGNAIVSLRDEHRFTSVGSSLECGSVIGSSCRINAIRNRTKVHDVGVGPVNHSIVRFS